MGFWDYEGLAGRDAALPSVKNIMNYRGAFQPPDSYRPGVKTSAAPFNFGNGNPFNQATMGVPPDLGEYVPAPQNPGVTAKVSTQVGSREGTRKTLPTVAKKSAGPEMLMGAPGVPGAGIRPKSAGDPTTGMGWKDAVSYAMGQLSNRSWANLGRAGRKGDNAAAELGAIMQPALQAFGAELGAKERFAGANVAGNTSFANNQLALAGRLQEDKTLAAHNQDWAKAQDQNAAYKQGMLGVARQNASTGEKALSFDQRLALKEAGRAGSKNYDDEIEKAIITKFGDDPEALSTAMTNYQNVRQGKVYQPATSTGWGPFKTKTPARWSDPAPQANEVRTNPRTGGKIVWDGKGWKPVE